MTRPNHEAHEAINDLQDQRDMLQSPQSDVLAAPNHEPLAAAPQDPAKVVAALFLTAFVLFVAWYAISDRYAPATGRAIVSSFVSQIAPRVSGQVVDVMVRDNQVVEAAAPLFRLDQRPFELAVAQAEANLAQALQADEVYAATVTGAQAKVSRARAKLDNARSTANRNQSLFERRVISQAQLDLSNTELVSFEQELKGAEAELATALIQLGGKDGATTPHIQAARVQLQQAQLNLLYSTVTAPTRGVITNLTLSVGQYAAPGVPVMTFIDGVGSWITADMRENQIGHVEPGDSVSILFDAMPGQVYSGRVQSIAWGVDPGRITKGGLIQNEPENRWFEPARRIPVNMELDGGNEAWPEKARTGGKVHVVIYAGGERNPVAWAAAGLQLIYAYLTYLY
ncbi:HlyD family secretion protein [Xanthobacter sediminis]